MKFFREPLVHFVLLGAAIFTAYQLLNRESPAGPQSIVVSPGQIEHMVGAFVRAWQRPPNDDEVKGLIDQYVREEIFAREAMKLGLDQNDVIIRRRLQQKMEFIADDFAAGLEPTEAELAAYLAKHPDDFRQDQRTTFRQVYLNPEKRGDKLAAEAAQMLADLKAQGAQADTSELGEPSLLPPALANEPQRGIENAFGGEFAAQLAKLPVGEWSGPVPSGFGSHLVFLEQRTAGRVPALAEVRAQVEREWVNERRTETNKKFLDALLKQYAVTIEWPRTAGKTTAAKP
jgi:PPIC-type PPIASE domain